MIPTGVQQFMLGTALNNETQAPADAGRPQGRRIHRY